MGHDRSYLWAVEAEEEEDRSAWAFLGRGEVLPSYVSASGYNRTFSLIICSVVFECPIVSIA